MELSTTDKQVLDIIQSSFPICTRPYLELANKLDISEEEVFNSVNKMREQKLIRRLGANFQSAKLGFRSTLCASQVPEDAIEEFVATLNAYPEITHNYLRKHKYNIWFTFIGENWDYVCQTLEKVTKKTGIKILNLPAKRMFKIKVDFQLSDD